MTNFLKNIGKGFLYIFVLPFFLVALAIYGVFGLFVFLFECVKGFFLFFTGRRLFDDFPEDIKAKEIMAKAQETLYSQPQVQIPPQAQPQVQPQINPMYGQPQYQQPQPQFQQPQPQYQQPQPQFQQPQPQYQQPLPEEYFKEDDSIENAVFDNNNLGEQDE